MTKQKHTHRAISGHAIPLVSKLNLEDSSQGGLQPRQAGRTFIPRRNPSWTGRFSGWSSPVLQSLFSAGVLSVSCMVFVAMGGSKDAASEVVSTRKEVTVEVAYAEPFDGTLDLETTGVVIPVRELNLAAEVSGRVVELSQNCRVGQTVVAGELIARIDPEGFEIEIKRLESALAQSEASLEETETEIRSYRRKIELAQRELELQNENQARLEQLVSTKAVSRSEVSSNALLVVNASQSLATAEDTLASLQAKHATLESGIAMAEQQLRRAELDLKRTAIVASIGGVVVSESIEVGTFIQAGMSLATIQGTDEMEVRCNLQMRQLQWLWKSSSRSNASNGVSRYAIHKVPVTISYALDGVEWDWKGTLEALDGGRIDEQTRMIPCRVRVDGPVGVSDDSSRSRGNSPSLLAGMFVNIRIHVQPTVELLEVPASAVQPGAYVWAVRDGKLQKTPLSLAHTTDDQVMIYAGGADELQANDAVVISPLTAPMSGTAVSVREAL